MTQTARYAEESLDKEKFGWYRGIELRPFWGGVFLFTTTKNGGFE